MPIEAPWQGTPNSPGILFRSEEHTSELQSRSDIVCRLLLEKKNGVAARSAAAWRSTRSSPRTAFLFSVAWFSDVLIFSGGLCRALVFHILFFFNDTATTEIYTLSLHDALPIAPAAYPLSRQNRYTPTEVALSG